jgi:hypothetical protein
LLSGVPKIIRNEITETTMDAMKIARQLMNCVIAPPNTAARPEPPHEPIDHIETARCRAGPSQYAFTSAIDAGMMHAAEKPWIARPASSNGKANPPTAKTSSREPTTPRATPINVILTRPTRSARPPVKTMNSPENKAVIETARFIEAASMNRGPMSSIIAGATVPVVPAKSQKVTTARTRPKRSLSVPW